MNAAGEGQLEEGKDADIPAHEWDGLSSVEAPTYAMSKSMYDQARRVEVAAERRVFLGLVKDITDREPALGLCNPDLEVSSNRLNFKLMPAL